MPKVAGPTLKSWADIRENVARRRKRRARSDWSYFAAVDEIYHARWAARQLARFDTVRRAVRHFWPDGYPVSLIQVAGTSGKGSTCHFIQAGLSMHLKAGCYVKPHVFDYAERFVVQNRTVSHDEVAEVWEEKVKPYCIQGAVKGEPWTLGQPEASILIALHVFAAHELDWAAVETGLGGRFDPVTALDVKATVLTNVGKDHEEVLGSEPWQRALEKSGICRPGVPLFTSARDPVTLEVLRAVSKDVGAKVVEVDEGDYERMKGAAARVGAVPGSECLLSSEHQLWNAALAARVVASLVRAPDPATLAKAFSKTRFVGRFWRVEEGVYADVAHNPSKTEALADEIRAKFPHTKKVFVVGISGERDPVALTAPLVPQALALVVTSAGYKGQDPSQVFRRLKSAFPSLEVRLERDPRATLALAKGLSASGEPVIFTGSTYMVDQALNKDARLRHLNGTYGWREAAER